MVKRQPVNAGDIRDLGFTLGWEDPLEEGMATHSSILAWRNPHRWRSLDNSCPQGHKESDVTSGLPCIHARTFINHED